MIRLHLRQWLTTLNRTFLFLNFHLFSLEPLYLRGSYEFYTCSSRVAAPVRCLDWLTHLTQFLLMSFQTLSCESLEIFLLE